MNENSQHTPGPWVVNYVIDGAFEIQATEQGAEIVVASRREVPRMHEEFMANAHLIAAAPDPLNACKLAEYAFRVPAGERLDDELKALELMRAAIAKAEGRS